MSAGLVAGATGTLPGIGELSLSANAVHARRPHSLYAGGSRYSSDDTLGIAGSWRASKALTLGLAARTVHSSGRGNPIQRMVDLAAGDPMAKSGIALTMDLATGFAPIAATLGLRLRDDHVSAADAALLGTRGGRSDKAVEMTLQRRF